MNFKKFLLETGQYRYIYPKHRGELTFDKVLKRIKSTSSLSTTSNLFGEISGVAWKEIKKFSSPQDFMEHIYWHGTGGCVIKGLKAGFAVRYKDAGGGYGEDYHVISLSKSKNKASNFTGMSSSGTVYPVLLRKGAKVKEITTIQDANEVDDILVDLWLDDVDAVKLGDWARSCSEEEIAILNPRAVLKFRGEHYPVFNKKKFENPKLDIYKAIFNTVKNNECPKNGKNYTMLQVEY